MNHPITRTCTGAYYMTNQGIRFIANGEEGPGVTLIIQGKDPRPDSNYDPEQLAAGIKEEMEHTDNPEIAAKIVKDHLDEDSGYYRKLKKAGL
jgi:hypothetical protein